MSSSVPAAPCSDALLWLAALAVGGAIACATPVPAATSATATTTAAATTAPAASPEAPGSGSAATPAAPVKASPYAAAKDDEEPGSLPVKAMEGTKAPGSKKSSPYAAAKDEQTSSTDQGLPGNDRFWALLIPVGVAAAIYGLLRQQESGGV